jgi:hypothetical protein
MTRISQEEVRMSMRLPNGNVQFVTFFTDENAEMYLLTVRDHKNNLVTLDGSKKSISSGQKLTKRTYTLYSTTKAVVIPTTEETARLVTQKKEWRVTRESREISSIAFSLFRRLLDGTAKEQWKMIIRDLPLMPCLVLNTQTSRETMPTMWDIIIRSLPPDGKTQLKVRDNEQLNQKVNKLLIQYEAIDKAMGQKRKDKNSQTKESPAKSGRNERGSEKQHSNDGPSNSYHILNKQKTEKNCNRCKEYGGRYDTHNTSDCKDYNADGTPNEEFQSNFPRSMDKPYKKWGEDYQQLTL